MSSCAHPERCGSDGKTCGHPDCFYKPTNLGYSNLPAKTPEEVSASKRDLEFQAVSCRRELLDEQTRTRLLEMAIGHALQYGKLGKQSKARLRAALKAIEVSRG